MDVNTVYKIVQYIVAKNQQGYVSPADFNLIINAAQIQYLDYLLGEFQQYQPGRPMPRVQFGMNETIRQALTPLINPALTLSIDNTTGIALYPDDFQQVDAIYDSTMNRIRFVSQDRLFSYLQSVIDPIEINPIYLIQNNGFKFYPITLGSAILSYVRTPHTIVWAYNPDANGRPVFNFAGSTDPEWYSTDCFDIIARALKMVGVNLQSPAVMQYASELKNVGQ